MVVVSSKGDLLGGFMAYYGWGSNTIKVYLAAAKLTLWPEQTTIVVKTESQLLSYW